MLERIQRRATEIKPKLGDISCEMLLRECGLTTLEARKFRDQTEAFKTLIGYDNIYRNIFLG